MKVDRSKTEYMCEKEGGKVNLHGVEIVKVRNKWIKKLIHIFLHISK